MYVYVKYSAKYPYLPEAVADSKTELAKMLGCSVDSVFSAFAHDRKTFAKVWIDEEEDEREINEK